MWRPSSRAPAAQAPMQQYAAVLLERAKQRLQMRTAQEMELGDGAGAGAGRRGGGDRCALLS